MIQPISLDTKILIIGNGGRENALAWALLKSTKVEKVFIAPGNGGTEDIPGCKSLDIKDTDTNKLIEICLSLKIELVVIGPEAPLANGLADVLRNKGIIVFGPGKDGAQLESSKNWAKELMSEAGIPTAKHWAVDNLQSALNIIDKSNQPLVVKVDGLASGKGVTVPENKNDSIQAVREAFQGKFGAAGKTIVLEEMLSGPEVSIFALCDGDRMIVLPPAQDHKRLQEGDKGPNTGGMGAYAPAPLINKKQLTDIQESILEPTLQALKNRNIDYRGVIYAGLMLTSTGAKVIEFNCRFGDPECQTLMPLLGPELAEVLLACALGKLNNSSTLSITKECSVCIVAATSGYPESPRKGDVLSIQIKTTDSIQLFHAGTKRNEKNQLLTAGGRVLSIVAQGSDFDKAFSIAYSGMKEVEFKGITYRRDIGHQVRKKSFSQI